MAPKAAHPAKVNVLPDWWAFTFMGLQLAALVPITYQHVTDPIGTFADVLPKGFDRATDGLKSSLRVELVRITGAQAYPMIIMLFLGCVLFARNSLKGQPELQQRLVKLPIYVGLFSDVWLYATMLLKLPRDVIMTPSIWTPPIAGIAYGLPVASLLKLVWLFGIGRDVV